MKKDEKQQYPQKTDQSVSCLPKTNEEIIDIAAKKILEKYRPAFEELAK